MMSTRSSLGLLPHMTWENDLKTLMRFYHFHFFEVPEVFQSTSPELRSLSGRKESSWDSLGSEIDGGHPNFLGVPKSPFRAEGTFRIPSHPSIAVNSTHEPRPWSLRDRSHKSCGFAARRAQGGQQPYRLHSPSLKYNPSLQIHQILVPIRGYMAMG